MDDLTNAHGDDPPKGDRFIVLWLFCGALPQNDTPKTENKKTKTPKKPYSTRWIPPSEPDGIRPFWRKTALNLLTCLIKTWSVWDRQSPKSLHFRESTPKSRSLYGDIASESDHFDVPKPIGHNRMISTCFASGRPRNAKSTQIRWTDWAPFGGSTNVINIQCLINIQCYWYTIQCLMLLIYMLLI